jgi:hypothetical protein
VAGDGCGDDDASASEDEDDVSACAASAEATMLRRGAAGYEDVWGVCRAAATPVDEKASEGEVRDAHAAARAAAAERRVLTMMSRRSEFSGKMAHVRARFVRQLLRHFSGGQNGIP